MTARQRQWEASTAAVEEAGVRRVVIRSGIDLGRDGGVLPRLSRPFRLFAGGPLAGGRQWVSWVHYDDELAAIKFLINNNETSGVYNLCAPGSLRNRDFSRIIGKTLKRPWWWPVPGAALRALYGEMADELLLASERAVPRRLSEAGFEFRYPDAHAALSNLLAD